MRKGFIGKRKSKLMVEKSINEENLGEDIIVLMVVLEPFRGIYDLNTRTKIPL